MEQSKKPVLTLESMASSGVPEVWINEKIKKASEAINWDDPNLSFKQLRTFATQKYVELRESNPAQAFGQLLRVGIQTIANQWYQRYPNEWPKYTTEVSSGRRMEFYAPIFGSQLPKRTGAGEPYTESRVVGVDREIINFKYMGGESFDRELFDDDQTGQIRQRAQNLGEAMGTLEEVYSAGRLLGSYSGGSQGTSLTIAGVTMPASTYATTNADGVAISGVYSTTMYSSTAGDGNRLATFAQLSFPALKQLYSQMLNAKDPLGVKLASAPDLLIVSTFDAMNARTFLNSTWYPAVQGLATQTSATATSGVAGQFGAINPFNGVLNLATNVYLPNGAWVLCQAKKGLVFQRRDPMEVIQELPQSGQSFNTDTYRFRSRSRWEQEWVEARYYGLGNDGSASVSQ